MNRLLSLGVVLLAANVVTAQVPLYRGEVLLEPGLDAGKCLTAASDNDGAVVTIEPCTNAGSQKWRFSSGMVQVFGNKCLDITDGSDADGVKLQIWTCADGNPNQQFYYTGDYHLAWTGRGKCMDLTNGGVFDGNRIQMWSCSPGINQVWHAGYHYTDLPGQSQDDQSGINNCGTGSSDTSQCQTAWINSADDFCLYGPPELDSIGNSERIGVAYCTQPGRGTRVMPPGTLAGVHFVKAPDYVQVTGVGDLTKLNIPAGDDGGEFDPHGADGRGNPIGSLVYGDSFGVGQQYHEWNSFISDDEFCFRACVGPRAATFCEHIYDVMGCYWNMPANYGAGVFEDCDADNNIPMGIYGTSTWYQGVEPTPAPHPAASSSNCAALPTVGVSA